MLMKRGLPSNIPAGFKPIVTRNGFPGAGTVRTTLNSYNGYLPDQAPADTSINDLVVMISGWEFGGSSPAISPDPYTWSLAYSIDYLGTRYPVTWDGASTATISPMSNAVCSDPVTIPGGIPAGATWALCPYGLTTLGSASYPTIRRRVSGVDVFEYGTNLANKTMSGVITGQDVFMRGAVTVGALTVTPGATFNGLVGDSWFFGFGNGPEDADAKGRWGFLAKSIGNAHGSFFAGSGGVIARGYCNSSGDQIRRAMVGVDRVLIGLGYNDIWSGYTAAQVLIWLKSIWAPFIAAGVPVYQSTIGPKTTSSDGWLTTANQTIVNASWETERNTLNTTIKGGGVGLTGYMDVCAVIESVSAPGKWEADGVNDWTHDGIHPGDYGITQMVSGDIVPAVFRT